MPGKFATLLSLAAITTLGFLRSAFHPAWLFVLLVISVFLGKANRSQRLFAFAPALLLVAWLVKNSVLFGVFGMTSWAPANLVAVTTRQMNLEERDAWIADGRLSRFAAIASSRRPLSTEAGS